MRTRPARLLAASLCALACWGCGGPAPIPTPLPGAHGIGVARAQWEREHVADTQPLQPVDQGSGPTYSYDHGRYTVTFWYAEDGTPPADAPVGKIEVFLPTGTLDEGCALTRALLPPDAQVLSPIPYKPGPPTAAGAGYYYSSAWLVHRFLPLAAGAPVWEAGTTLSPVQPGEGIFTCYGPMGSGPGPISDVVYAILRYPPAPTATPCRPPGCVRRTPCCTPIPTVPPLVPQPVPSGEAPLPTAVPSTGPPPGPTVAATAVPPGASPSK